MADKKKYETESGHTVSFDYQTDETAEGRENVFVGGEQVGYLYEEDGTFSAHVNPAQQGAGFGVYREVARGVSKKDATQALADALGEHAEVNVLGR